MSLLSRVSLRTAVAAAVLVVVLGLAFVILTQTQVGRDGVAGQLERQFSNQFEGTLHIGRLSGNLVWDLHARDVSIRDADGQVVLAADSVVINPRWRSLISNRLDIRRVELHRPRIDLVRDEDASWNLAGIFSSRDEPREDARALGLDAAEIRIIDGTASSRTIGAADPAVRSGAVFDYGNTDLTQLNARLRLQSGPSGLTVRLRQLDGFLPHQNIDVSQLRGRLQVKDQSVSGSAVTLRLAESRVSGSFATDELGDLQLNITRSNLAGGEVQRLLPAFPFGEGANLALQARGPLSAIQVRRIILSDGESRVRGSGLISGLPDALDYDLDFTELNVRSADLRNAFPDLLPSTSDFGTLSGIAHAHGRIDWSGGLNGDSDAIVDLRSDAGSIRGRLALTTQDGQGLRYVIDVDMRNVDLARISGDGSLSSDLSGTIAADGTGVSASDLEGRLRFALEPSRLGGRAIDGLSADLQARGGTVTGNASLMNSGGLSAEGSISMNLGRAELTLAATDFDLRDLHPGAPRTSLTGTAMVSLAGGSLDDVIADLTLALEGSTISTGESNWDLPTEPIAISIRPNTIEGARLRVETDALVIEGRGDFQWTDLLAAGEFWSARFAEATDRDLLPHMNGRNGEGRSNGIARPHIPEQGFELSLTTIKEEALQPWLGVVAPGTSIEVAGRVSGDSLIADVGLTADRLGIGSVRFTRSQAELRFAAAASGELLDNLNLALDIDSSRLRVNGGEHMDTALRLIYEPVSRTLTIGGDFARPADDIAGTLEARVAILKDRYNMLGNFILTAGDDQWRIDDGNVDLFTDGFIFHSFEAHRTGGDADWGSAEDVAPHSILRLRGIASARPADRLHVHGHNLVLGEILSLVSDGLPFDGLASADLEVSGVLSQPAVVGHANVEDFTIWGDPAGRIVATSEIDTGRDGFDVDLRLTPADHESHILNAGRLGGRMSFPGRAADGSRDSGFFDLGFDFERLDLFIFNHLFPDIVAGSRGGGHGSGTITGDWSFPVFDAEFHVADGRAHVPAFNLGLTAAGRVTVNREGIHLHDIDLRDKAGGTGLVNGGILFNEYRFFSFDLGAQLKEFEVIDVGYENAGDLRFFGSIRATASATLTGPMDNVLLHSPDVVTTPDSRVFIPVTASAPAADAGFLVFTDAEGRVPEIETRRSLIAERPDTEREFLDGLDMLLNVRAPHGSTVHLVFDPAVGDVINAVGSATLQLAISEGEFKTYGTFEVDRGDYLFTAGQVFTRRFELEQGGTLIWDGDPVDAQMNLPASYRTRASLAGLGIAGVSERQRVPIVIGLQVGGRVVSPLVDLTLALDESGGRTITAAEPLRRRLNEPDRQAEYATSVLLTNTFLLAPSDPNRPLSDAADDLFYTSLSELVSSRLNLFLNQALAADNIDVAVGVQQGSGIQEFDLTYGLALRLLDERLIIRGEGIYHQLENAPVTEALQGELAIEMRVSDTVSLEVFYRREGDLLIGTGVTGSLIEAYGAGVNYQAEFTGWRHLIERIFAVAESEEAKEEGPDSLASSGD